MEDAGMSPVKLVRTKSWKEYDAKDEIPFILNEGFLPVKFQANESVSIYSYRITSNKRPGRLLKFSNFRRGGYSWGRFFEVIRYIFFYYY